MNYLAIWEHALDHLKHTDPDWERTLNHWRHERPEWKSDRDLLQEYGWVVACCGLTAKAILPRWERLGAVLGHWAPAQAAAAPRHEVLAVLANRRKIDAIQGLAADLAREPGQMQRLAAKPVKEVLAWMSTLPFVGANNRYHLARNLGWDVIVKNGPVPRLAGMLHTTAEQLCEGIAAETGERLRVVDLVLWQWGNDVGDEAMHRMAGLFRIL
jgi:hypothetical protein